MDVGAGVVDGEERYRDVGHTKRLRVIADRPVGILPARSSLSPTDKALEKMRRAGLKGYAHYHASRCQHQLKSVCRECVRAGLAPDDAAVRDTIGWVYYRKGIYRSAVEQLKMSVAKESTPQRQFHLAIAYLKVGDKDLGRACQHYGMAQ